MTTLILPADQLPLIPAELLETAGSLNNRLRLAQLRGERPDWKRWAKEAEPDQSVTLLSVLCSLVDQSDAANPSDTATLPEWNIQASLCPFEYSEMLPVSIRRLLAGHANSWLDTPTGDTTETQKPQKACRSDTPSARRSAC